MEQSKCMMCGRDAQGFKCDVCAIDAQKHDSLHACGPDHLMPKCSGCDESQVRCTCDTEPIRAARLV